MRIMDIIRVCDFNSEILLRDETGTDACGVGLLTSGFGWRLAFREQYNDATSLYKASSRQAVCWALGLLQVCRGKDIT